MVLQIAAQFHKAVTRSLSRLPLLTSRGIVTSERRNVRFGSPSGGFGGPAACWIYQVNRSDLVLFFGFRTEPSGDEFLICKVLCSGEPLDDGIGASVQFKCERFVRSDEHALVLWHDGRVTVRSPVKRQELLKQIRAHAGAANAALGGIAFPFICGSTNDLGSLLDRLFLYCYAIEQAKRAIRSEMPLPELFDPVLVESHIEAEIRHSPEIPETEKEQLIKARVGQGLFRVRQLEYWHFRCCLTACDFQDVLRASHIKPWRDSTSDERLDKYNGLLLAPNADALLDRGLISFDDAGTIVISPRLPETVLSSLGLGQNMAIPIEDAHKKYLAHHREIHKANFLN